jgi:sterol desaturase/sphingolipid hydroxylase (fatty acid hydroxylase superfamily)
VFFPRQRGRTLFGRCDWIGTSTFHAKHHEHRQFDFGFYKLTWDKRFGTLDPESEARFAGRK